MRVVMACVAAAVVLGLDDAMVGFAVAGAAICGLWWLAASLVRNKWVGVR